jgi:mannan endo-1,4-beta-mannosidase
MNKSVILFIPIIALLSCLGKTGQDGNKADNANDGQGKVVIRNQQTEKLFENLKKLSAEGKIMFGMANPTSIGYISGPKNNQIDQSDSKDITGSHPAFHESDLMWYSDTTFKKYDMEALRQAYKRGAVCGYCWHFRGRHSQEFYAKKDGKFTGDKDLVKQIIASPDRASNDALDWFLNQLDNEVIPVFRELGFPLVFRPFHEMNGNWFWWGTDNCTPEEYQKLFRITVDYLRKNKINNLLIAWSVNVDVSFEHYPGNDYVDILGLDSYEPGIEPWNPMEKFIASLGQLTDYAAKHQKVAALTETGCRKENGKFRYSDKYPKFWTEHILEPILADVKAKRIVWMLSWYNADWKNDLTGQYYIPYKMINRPNSQKAVKDFIDFYKSEHLLFENELPDMYN